MSNGTSTVALPFVIRHSTFQIVTALEAANQLKAKFGDLVSEPVEFRGEITQEVADAEKIVEVCGLRDERSTCWLELSNKVDDHWDKERHDGEHCVGDEFKRKHHPVFPH